MSKRPSANKRTPTTRRPRVLWQLTPAAMIPTPTPDAQPAPLSPQSVQEIHLLRLENAKLRNDQDALSHEQKAENQIKQTIRLQTLQGFTIFLDGVYRLTDITERVATLEMAARKITFHLEDIKRREANGEVVLMAPAKKSEDKVVVETERNTERYKMKIGEERSSAYWNWENEIKEDTDRPV